MLGLKRRHTYDELLNIIKTDGEKKVELPNRIASQIRGSIKYQGLLNDHLNELQEIQNKIHKQSILTHEIRQQNGTGNHQINMKLSNDGDYDTALGSIYGSISSGSSSTSSSSSSANNTSSSSSSSSSSDITSTISSVEDELERKRQDQLKRITEPDTRGYISNSIEGMMLEERVRIDKEVNVGRPKSAGGHLGQMKEMMRALHNRELGNNEEFIEDLMELNERITGKSKELKYGSGHKLTAESTHQISVDILKLWREYLKFKSSVYVHTPEYAAIHKEVMAKVKAK